METYLSVVQDLDIDYDDHITLRAKGIAVRSAGIHLDEIVEDKDFLLAVESAVFSPSHVKAALQYRDVYAFWLMDYGSKLQNQGKDDPTILT